MNTNMTKERVKDIADTICTFACNISWGKPIICRWEADDVLVFTNDRNAYESWWNAFDWDIEEVRDIVCHLTRMNPIEMDAHPERSEEINTFKCGLKWKEA